MKTAAGTSSDDAIPANKRVRITASGKPHLLKRYPIRIMSREQMSAEALEGAQLALKEEEEKIHPDPDIYLQLMKSTFVFRRQYIVSEAESAQEIMEKHPFLKFEAVVSMCVHMCFI